MNSDLPWRVEFRPFEVMFTPEQQFLLAYPIQVLFRMVTCKEFGLNLYIPMSYIHENRKRGLVRNSVTTQKFFFRRNVFDQGAPKVVEITLAEFINGSNNFIGV